MPNSVLPATDVLLAALAHIDSKYFTVREEEQLSRLRGCYETLGNLSSTQIPVLEEISRAVLYRSETRLVAYKEPPPEPIPPLVLIPVKLKGGI